MKRRAAVKSSAETQNGSVTKTDATPGRYQVSDDFLEELGTFLHLVLRTSQLDDVTLLSRVGEVDNNLEEDDIKLFKLNWNWIKQVYRDE